MANFTHDEVVVVREGRADITCVELDIEINDKKLSLTWGDVVNITTSKGTKRMQILGAYLSPYAETTMLMCAELTEDDETFKEELYDVAVIQDIGIVEE